MVAILTRMGFKSTYAMHDNNARSSNNAWLLKNYIILALPLKIGISMMAESCCQRRVETSMWNFKKF